VDERNARNDNLYDIIKKVVVAWHYVFVSFKDWTGCIYLHEWEWKLLRSTIKEYEFFDDLYNSLFEYDIKEKIERYDVKSIEIIERERCEYKRGDTVRLVNAYSDMGTNKYRVLSDNEHNVTICHFNWFDTGKSWGWTMVVSHCDIVPHFTFNKE
jgi:hypothetical protein